MASNYKHVVPDDDEETQQGFTAYGFWGLGFRILGLGLQSGCFFCAPISGPQTSPAHSHRNGRKGAGGRGWGLVEATYALRTTPNPMSRYGNLVV